MQYSRWYMAELVFSSRAESQEPTAKRQATKNFVDQSGFRFGRFVAVLGLWCLGSVQGRHVLLAGSTASQTVMSGSVLIF